MSTTVPPSDEVRATAATDLIDGILTGKHPDIVAANVARFEICDRGVIVHLKDGTDPRGIEF